LDEQSTKGARVVEGKSESGVQHGKKLGGAFEFSKPEQAGEN